MITIAIEKDLKAYQGKRTRLLRDEFPRLSADSFRSQTIPSDIRHRRITNPVSNPSQALNHSALRGGFSI